MWIRTSDRRAIIDTSGMTLRISREPDGNIGIIAYGNNNPSYAIEKLASYDNEQRAIEVLDEICKKYSEIEGYENQIYQMPEK